MVMYQLLAHIALPFVLLRLLIRSIKNPGYRTRWRERFGEAPRLEQCVWVHAVSLGEVIAVTPLVNALLAKQQTVLLTTTTPTGSAQVTQTWGDRVHHCYVPYDLVVFVNRFLNRATPTLAIFVETELWPTLIAKTDARNIPIIIANARLSERSLKRYQKIGETAKNMLSKVSCVIAQSKEDGERFVQLGFPKDKLIISGNIKYDYPIPDKLPPYFYSLKESLRHRPVWIAASTHPEEEKSILETHQAICESIEDPLLIFVPRHPERFSAVESLLAEQHIRFEKRSDEHHAIKAETSVFLGDSLGELFYYYALSDIAFVGGSLHPHGGHNLLEPAALGKPVFSGPHLFHFQAIEKALREEEALTIAKDTQSLAKAIIDCLNHPEKCKTLGQQARKVFEKNKGALDIHCQTIEAFLH